MLALVTRLKAPNPPIEHMHPYTSRNSSGALRSKDDQSRNPDGRDADTVLQGLRLDTVSLARLDSRFVKAWSGKSGKGASEESIILKPYSQSGYDHKVGGSQTRHSPWPYTSCGSTDISSIIQDALKLNVNEGQTSPFIPLSSSLPLILCVVDTRSALKNL